MITDKKIVEYAEALYNAEKTRVAIDPLSKDKDFENLDSAYAVQLKQIEKKLKKGEKIVGKKIGLTSIPMQEMFNVESPDYGHLTDKMWIKDGKVSPGHLIQPKVEAEIAFVLKNDLKGPNITAEQVLESTKYVMAAFEIVDSRIRDWEIGLLDTVSDNASSGMFLLGNHKIAVDEINLNKEAMKLEKNGEFVNEGLGSAALGDPAYCVAWLANKMSEYGVTLKKGEVILSGALSAALDARPGDSFKAFFSTLGEIEVIFEE